MAVCVVATDEEQEIAQQTRAVVEAAGLDCASMIDDGDRSSRANDNHDHTSSPIGDLAVRQLLAIGEIATLAAAEGIEVWLRGGWAMDFFLGELTRPHTDVDWFCWATDADRLTATLHTRGYADDLRVPPEIQRDLVRDGVEVSFALLARDAQGRVVVGGAGPWAGSAYPDAMLTGPAGRLGDVTCPIISPQAQIELKEMYPVWMPERPRRPKDRDDIARLRRVLDGSPTPLS